MDKIKTKLFLFTKEVIDEKKKGFFLIFFKLFLRAISFFWFFYISIKNFLYDKKFFKPKKYSPFVISIGNIVAGGVGKTPFTIFLAKKLQDNHKIGIISRGYKSKNENKTLVVKKDDNYSFSEIGDEPLMMKNQLKDVVFIIGKDRKKALEEAEKLNLDIVLLDDGFQNRKIVKDLDVVVINAKDPFGKNYFLPRGYLRENKNSLKRADYIIVNNAFEKKDFEIEKELKKHSKAKIFFSKYIPSKFFTLSNIEKKIKETSKVAIFCSIANPSLFHKTIKDMGHVIVHELYLMDHEKIQKEKLFDFIKRSKEEGAEYIITTHKDAVKLDHNFKHDVEIIYVEIILKLISDKLFSLST